jgi:5-methylcytosine-specific restriction endonuclease McrA
MQEELVRTRKRVHRVPIKLCTVDGCYNPVRHWRTNIYCSNKCRGSVIYKNSLGDYATTEGNPGYVDGFYSSTRKQKKSAYDRDNGCCVKCGMVVDGKNQRYGVHHIIPRRLIPEHELADSLENLITLCSKDHREVEAQFVEHLYSLYSRIELLDPLSLIQYLRNKI